MVAPMRDYAEVADAIANSAAISSVAKRFQGIAQDEIRSEVFHCFLQRPEGFRRARRLEAYLAGCARLAGRTILKSRARDRARCTAQADAIADLSQSDDSLHLTENRELRDMCAVAISQLNALEQELLRTVLLDGKKLTVVAGKMGINYERAKTRLRRARQKLSRDPRLRSIARDMGFDITEPPERI